MITILAERQFYIMDRFRREWKTHIFDANGGKLLAVDADDLAFQINKRPSAVARVNGGIGLNQAIRAVDTSVQAAYPPTDAEVS